MLDKIEKERTRKRNWYHKNKIKVRETQRAYDKLHKEDRKKYNRNYKLMAAYSISTDKYDEMFVMQGGRCASCGVHQIELSRPLFVDHDHRTGIVRGLLCNNCNVSIGLMNDDISKIKNLINYLLKYTK